jgi:hypothetical protein
MGEYAFRLTKTRPKKVPLDEYSVLGGAHLWKSGSQFNLKLYLTVHVMLLHDWKMQNACSIVHSYQVLHNTILRNVHYQCELRHATPLFCACIVEGTSECSCVLELKACLVQRMASSTMTLKWVQDHPSCKGTRSRCATTVIVN